MIETSSGLLRSSSTIVVKCSEMFGTCSEAFVWPSEQFWKIFGNLRKVAGNLQKSSKTSSLVCLYNKQTQYLLRSLVKYRVEHSKIKFVFTSGQVISSTPIN